MVRHVAERRQLERRQDPGVRSFGLPNADRGRKIDGSISSTRIFAVLAVCYALPQVKRQVKEPFFKIPHPEI